MSNKIFDEIFGYFFVLNNSTQLGNDNNNNNSFYFDESFFHIDNYLTICLSTLSCFTLIFFSITYTISQIKLRDCAKETRKSAFKKLYRNEYLVISYCVNLFISHFLTLFHKIVSQFFFDNITQMSSYCLIIGISKHFFWLAAIFHSNAISIKIYFKLTQSIENNIFNRKKWLMSALKVFAYIYGSTITIIALSVGIHYFSSQVYELNGLDKINYCFLSQPIFLLGFFAIPITIILCVNLILFIILFFKTKSTINHSENEEMNNLFLKLAAIMGLSWIIYVICIIIFEIFAKYFYVQILIIIASCQINLQGTIVVISLFSNAVFEFIVKKKKKIQRILPQSNRNNKITVLC